MNKLIISLVLILATSIAPILPKSLTEANGYAEHCAHAATSDKDFADFRRNSWIYGTVDTVDYTIGQAFATLLNEKYNIPILDKLLLDDAIGNPIMYHFSNIGKCSGTLLRYINVAAELKEKFGNLDNLKIVEIGGGYGGQCKVLHDMFGFNNYTIIDLPDCLPLIKKYLSHFDIKNIKLLGSSTIKKPHQYDLVISNYAISEIDKVEQLNYITNIINLAPRGYLLYNVCPDIDPLTPLEFAKILSTDHPNVQIETEYPSTHPNNVLITWSPNL